jgi:hypothetical protein
MNLQARILFVLPARFLLVRLASRRARVRHRRSGLPRILARLRLQPHPLFASLVVCASGAGLVAATLPGPGQHQARLDRCRPDQRDQQPADLGNRQRQQAEPAAQPAASPFDCSGLLAWARVTARNACASSARVTWRYQPGQRRTS